MKKILSKMVLFILVLSLLFVVGCRKEEEETATEVETTETTETQNVEDQKENDEEKDQVLDKLEGLKADENISAKEISTFITEEGEGVLNEVEVDDALNTVRNRWKKELAEFNDYVNQGDVKTALAAIKSDGIIDKEELKAISDEPIVDRLANDVYDGGYLIRMKGGQPVVEVNYQHYKDLNQGSFAWKDYIALKDAQQQNPWKIGNTLNITPKELVERLQAHEKYFNSYGNAELSLEIKDEFNAMLDALMKGLPETPISDETNLLKAEFKEAYEMAAEEDTTVLGQTLSRYLEVLKVKDWKVDQEVLDGATRLTDNAGNLIQRTK